jgi:hypothetical protein
VLCGVLLLECDIFLVEGVELALKFFKILRVHFEAD